MASGKPLSKMHQRINATADARNKLGEAQAPHELNTFWDDAQSLYRQSIEAIVLTHGQLAQSLKVIVTDKERLALIKDPRTLVDNINLLCRDIDEHIGRLNAIHEKHKGRAGSTMTPDEHMAVIQIHGQYNDALHVYDTTVMPTVAHIFEQIGTVEELLLADQQAKAAEAKAALTNPAVVSDIEVKEVKAENA